MPLQPAHHCLRVELCIFYLKYVTFNVKHSLTWIAKKLHLVAIYGANSARNGKTMSILLSQLRYLIALYFCYKVAHNQCQHIEDKYPSPYLAKLTFNHYCNKEHLQYIKIHTLYSVCIKVKPQMIIERNYQLENCATFEPCDLKDSQVCCLGSREASSDVRVFTIVAEYVLQKNCRL